MTTPAPNAPAPAPAPGPTAPTTTQQELAGSDGAGIRGDYGDAEQTNGLEGGGQAPADAAPDTSAAPPENL